MLQFEIVSDGEDIMATPTSATQSMQWNVRSADVPGSMSYCAPESSKLIGDTIADGVATEETGFGEDVMHMHRLAAAFEQVRDENRNLRLDLDQMRNERDVALRRSNLIGLLKSQLECMTAERDAATAGSRYYQNCNDEAEMRVQGLENKLASERTARTQLTEILELERRSTEILHQRLVSAMAQCEELGKQKPAHAESSARGRSPASRPISMHSPKRCHQETSANLAARSHGAAGSSLVCSVDQIGSNDPRDDDVEELRGLLEEERSRTALLQAELLSIRAENVELVGKSEAQVELHAATSRNRLELEKRCITLESERDKLLKLLARYENRQDASASTTASLAVSSHVVAPLISGCDARIDALKGDTDKGSLTEDELCRKLEQERSKLRLLEQQLETSGPGGLPPNIVAQKHDVKGLCGQPQCKAASSSAEANK